MKLVIANWKMAMGLKDCLKLAGDYVKISRRAKVKLVICPPTFALSEVRQVLKKSKIQLGAQDVSWLGMGAYTGETAASALAELGCVYVIIGHSERRQVFGDSDRLVNLKIQIVAQQKKLTPILCVGENWQERSQGQSQAVVKQQLRTALAGVKLKRLLIAYEPVWAIGSGKAIEPKDAQVMHRFIKTTVEKLVNVKTKFSILYGGSVSHSNAATLLALSEVDGLLVGSASWLAAEFAKIVDA